MPRAPHRPSDHHLRGGIADIVEDPARLQNRPENVEVMYHTGEIARDSLGIPDSEDSHENWMSIHI